MNIILYRNNSDVNYITKNISKVYELTGFLIGECSVTDPVINIEFDGDIKSFNYFYIPEFAGRYYYLTNFVMIRTGLYQISGHVDVLMTYAPQIKLCTGLINRQENLYNLYLDDDKFKVNANRRYGVKTFPGEPPASGAKMVLIAAGGTP